MVSSTAAAATLASNLRSCSSTARCCQRPAAVSTTAMITAEAVMRHPISSKASKSRSCFQ